MVGHFVLMELLAREEVQEIISITRRECGIKHEKLSEIIHDDFLDFSSLDLKEIDICIYCLGVYQGQVSKDKFYKITCDFQKALTDMLEKSNPDLIFALFSAQGAEPNGARVTFADAKGKAETQLWETCFPKKYIFRAGYIHPTGDRKPTGFAYKIFIPIMRILYPLFPLIGTTDHDLAKAMVNVALDASTPSRVLEVPEIKDNICLSSERLRQQI